MQASELHRTLPYYHSLNSLMVFCLQPVSVQHMDSVMKEFLDRDCVSVKLDGPVGSVKPNLV